MCGGGRGEEGGCESVFEKNFFPDVSRGKSREPLPPPKFVHDKRTQYPRARGALLWGGGEVGSVLRQKERKKKNPHEWYTNDSNNIIIRTLSGRTVLRGNAGDSGKFRGPYCDVIYYGKRTRRRRLRLATFSYRLQSIAAPASTAAAAADAVRPPPVVAVSDYCYYTIDSARTEYTLNTLYAQVENGPDNYRMTARIHKNISIVWYSAVLAAQGF